MVIVSSVSRPLPKYSLLLTFPRLCMINESFTIDCNKGSKGSIRTKVRGWWVLPDTSVSRRVDVVSNGSIVVSLHKQF